MKFSHDSAFKREADRQVKTERGNPAKAAAEKKRLDQLAYQKDQESKDAREIGRSNVT